MQAVDLKKPNQFISRKASNLRAYYKNKQQLESKITIVKSSNKTVLLKDDRSMSNLFT